MEFLVCKRKFRDKPCNGKHIKQIDKNKKDFQTAALELKIDQKKKK